MSFLSIFNPSRKSSPAASPVADPPSFIGPVASPSASDARCDSEGFYQHLGECWNDSIQMIFLFSDGLKEIVQPALLDPNFDSKVEIIINDENNKLFFLFKSDLVGLNTTNLGAVNNPFANNSSKAVLASKVRERKNAIIEYFKVLKKRFMRHYTNESLRRDSVCDTETARDHQAFQIMAQISRAAGKDGIAAAVLGHVNTKGVNRSHINVEELRKKKAEKQYSPGGNKTDEEYLFRMYKLVFFNKYNFNYTIFFPALEPYGFVGDSLILSEISKDLIQNSKAVYIGSYIFKYENKKNKKTDGHATAFYTCGGSQIYYEDNSGIYPFPWKEFLLKAVELYEKDNTTKLICGNNTETATRLEIQKSTFYPMIKTGYRNYDNTMNNEFNKNSATYYTFINDSPLLKSKDGHFKYNGVLINVADDENVPNINDLIFMTIDNNQSVNTQRFNHNARHSGINFDNFEKYIEQPNPDSYKIIQFLQAYIQSNNLMHYKFFKDNLSYEIGKALKKVNPPNPELNKKLLELAEAHLDLTNVEELRKLIPKPPSLYPNLPSLPQSYIPQPFYSTHPILAKGKSPHYGGYRKRKTRYQKRLIKRKTQKKRRSRR
jgi:hypothetical protein